MDNDLKYLNAFNTIPGVGSATLRLLKKYFGSYEAAWRADEGAVRNANLDARAVNAILWKRHSVKPDQEMQKMMREQIWIITLDDTLYPALLKEIHNPPVALYCRGSRAILESRTRQTTSQTNKQSMCIGVVGTRRPTPYGIEATNEIVSGLARAGITIVSGLALGIDARAHEAALDAHADTIAILGSGSNHESIFPPENRGLARRIADTNGIILTEYAPGTPAVKEHFPQRNRIIAGLSRGVLVVEARERSGALITARFALEENRDVFAVPGSIFSATSTGPNILIREGARPICSAHDMLEELGIDYTKESRAELQQILLSQDEQIVFELLQDPASIDDIKTKTGLATAAIMTALSLLELKGAIRNLGQDTYQKI